MDLICRFVYKNGREYGESIDVFENHLIVKVFDKFIAIPMDKVSFDGEKITIGDFDEGKGAEIASKWLNRSKAVSDEELRIFGFGEEDGV
ncbi:MAG: DUF5749 family beta-barrel protein [Archaeoglobaceae archaeon]